MEPRKRRVWTRAIAWVLVVGGMLLVTPEAVRACACGCSIFDVGGGSMLPSGPGRTAFLEYDYMDQSRNWNGSSSASSAKNDDKDLETHFTVAGLQYMFNRQWGAQAEVPYTFRSFKGTDDATGLVTSHDWSQLGDIRIRGLYTGFLEDMSLGVTLGLKLPTGSFKEDRDLVDRDTQIGTGSLDALLGGFYRTHPWNGNWDWFVQAQADLPTVIQDHYRPGIEFDAATGIDYTGFTLARVQISPVAQVLYSNRASDSGPNADSDNTGFQRIMLSPGIEFELHPFRLYFDVEIPVFQDFTGNQLAAPVLVKAVASWMF